MSRTARPWRGAGLLLLGGALLSGVIGLWRRRAADFQSTRGPGPAGPRPGGRRTAETFFKKALELDPANACGSRDSSSSSVPTSVSCAWHAGSGGRQAGAAKDPAADAPRPMATTGDRSAADTKATLEQTQTAENIARQELTDNVEQRIQQRSGAHEARTSPRRL